MTMDTNLLSEIEEESAIAYSRDNYSDGAWRGAIKYLHSQGFDKEAIVETLRSKHMRWCHDYWYGRKGVRNVSGVKIAEYLSENLSNIKEMLKNELNIIV